MKSPNNHELKSLGDMSTRISYMIMENVINDKELTEYPKYPNYVVPEDMYNVINHNPLTKIVMEHKLLFEALVSDKLMHRIQYMVDEGFGVIDGDYFIPIRCDDSIED
jgi:hypothetical protein